MPWGILPDEEALMALPAESIDRPGSTTFPPGPGWPTLIQTAI
jgi:hypothetical protein